MALCLFREDHPQLLFDRILKHLLVDSEVRLLAMTNTQWRGYIVSYFKIPRPLIYHCKAESFLTSLPLYVIAKKQLGFKMSLSSEANRTYGQLSCPAVFTKMFNSSNKKEQEYLTFGAQTSGNPQKNLVVKTKRELDPETFLMNIFRSHNLGIIMYGLSICPQVDISTLFICEALKSGDVDILNLTLSLCSDPVRYFNMADVFASGSKTLFDYVKQIAWPTDNVVMSRRCALFAIKNDHADMLKVYYDEYLYLGEDFSENVWNAFYFGSINCLRFLYQKQKFTPCFDAFQLVFDCRNMAALTFLVEVCKEPVDNDVINQALLFASYEQMLYLKQFIKPDMDLSFETQKPKRKDFIETHVLPAQNKKRRLC